MTHSKNTFPVQIISSFDYLQPGAPADAVNALAQRERVEFGGSAYTDRNREGRWDYRYDPKGQLTGADRLDETGGVLPTAEGATYTFDDIGNRLAATQGGSTTNYVPDAFNQYDSISVVGGATVQPVHDEDGNLTDDGTLLYGWDAENRLVSVTRKADGQPVASYLYDYRGRRVWKATTAHAPQGGGETCFLYDGWNLVAEYDAAAGQVSGLAAPERTFTWGLDMLGSWTATGGVGALLAIHDGAGGLANKHLPLYDGSGNVVQLENPYNVQRVDSAL